MSLPNAQTIKVSSAYLAGPGVVFKDNKWFCGIVCDEVPLSLHIFEKKNPEKTITVTVPAEYRIGSMYSFALSGRLDGLCYSIGENRLPDLFAVSYCYTGSKTDCFGEKRDFMQSVFSSKQVSMQFSSPSHKASELLFYKLHVRGFSKLCKENSGTFSALAEKAEYIGSLGMNAVLLMPAYDFNELPFCVTGDEKRHTGDVTKLNYWGYTNGFYFAPKRAYCTGDDVIGEFANMVDCFHKHGIEVFMEFFFPGDINPTLALHVLRFWHLTYKIDGFRIIGNDSIFFTARTDAYLSDCKFLGMNFAAQVSYDTTDRYTENEKDRLIWYDEGFMQAGRHFLRGDEGSLLEFLEKSRRHQYGLDTVNYMADQDGFSLMDMVSYEYKHNDHNGESNRDGKRINISFNCGIEGPVKNAGINKKRIKMIKNALCFTFLSASVPLLMAGDEFGMTHQGNNNPYCQDNEINYIDWKLSDKNKELVDFVRQLTAFRREYCCIRPKREFTLSDSMNLGMPDISYHGERAWYPVMEDYARYIGVLYCGAYANEKKNVYILYNMHNTEHEFALVTYAGTEFNLVLASDKSAVRTDNEGKKVFLKPGTVAVLVS